MSQVFGIFADNFETFIEKLYMKTLFRAILSLVIGGVLCATSFSSCTTNEVYDFEFELPGQIVTEFSKTIVVPFKARNITSIVISSSPKGWKVENIDLKNWTITITSPENFANDDNKIVENGTLSLTGYTAAGTAVHASSYLSLLRLEKDLTAEYSNSYIITEKDTRYTIDVSHKGESSETISPAKVEVLWQTSINLISHCSFYPESNTFSFYVGSEDVTDNDGNKVGRRIIDGNALVAAYDDNDNIIWSWHLWLTGSDPNDNAIETSAGVFMDRNLGAYHNSDGTIIGKDIYKAYGMYYQWGRKDPFARPTDYLFSSNRDQILYNYLGGSHSYQYVNSETDGVGSYEYAVAHPMSFIVGEESNDYDWLYSSHDNTLWSDTSKSINDPCPRGWRIPESNAFTAFDIAEEEDGAALADIRNMYGWHLVDSATGTKMFMPGAGRRSFETGVLTNINNYGFEHNPMPWTGYYWTTGSDATKATSMFFDLNTTRAVNNRYEPTKPMYRANAMQVRCVRE